MLTLYDPDRSQTVTRLGQDAHLGRAPIGAFAPAMREAARSSRGAGLRLLTETVVSPTLAEQIERL